MGQQQQTQRVQNGMQQNLLRVRARQQRTEAIEQHTQSRQAADNAKLVSEKIRQQNHAKALRNQAKLQLSRQHGLQALQRQLTEAKEEQRQRALQISNQAQAEKKEEQQLRLER